MSPLLINEPPLQVLPSLAEKIGLNEALMLSQVHYCLTHKLNDVFFEGEHWTHSTYEQWQEHFPFWSLRTIQRVASALEREGLLLTVTSADFQKKKHYTIDYDKLRAVQVTADQNKDARSLKGEVCR